MFFKLALRNIRKSVGDFALYFITVAVGVCMFYVFNAIDSQQIMFDINSSQSEYVALTGQIMSMLSGVVACVLGFLIMYANRFLMRRRRREFGIYLTLGASGAHIARMIVYEALIVGLASLALGLLCGIALSQGLAFVTAALMGTTISNFHFVFSLSALVQTLISFAIIYAVVTLCNVVQARRLNITSMLNAGRTNEKQPVRNPALMAVLFVAACVLLGLAYWQLRVSGMADFESPAFLRATAFMLVGSLLFFYSLAGFVAAFFTRTPRLYLRGLVPFTVGQITSRINTAFVSLWAICVMLFFAITIFSCGFGMVQVFCGNLDEVAPYDASVRADWAYINADYAEELSELENKSEASQQDYVNRRSEIAEELETLDPNTQDYKLKVMEMLTPSRLAFINSYEGNMAEALASNTEGWSKAVAQSAQVDIYQVAGLSYGDLFAQAEEQDPSIKNTIGSNDASDINGVSLAQMSDNAVQVVSVSQVNQTLALIGGSPIELASNSFAILNNIGFTQKVAKAISQTSLNIAGTQLLPTGSVYSVQLETSAISGSVLIVVVPDSVINLLKDQGAIPYYSYLNLQYTTTNLEAGDALLNQVLCSLEGISMIDNDLAFEENTRAWPASNVTQKTQMTIQAGGLRMLITYLAVYLAFVLLIATASILAIHQLTQATDSAPRYAMLKKLGCSQGMLSHSLFATTLVYFLAPLALAGVHAAVAISVLKTSLFDAMGTSNILAQCVLGAGILLVAYALYFGITFILSKRIALTETETR